MKMSKKVKKVNFADIDAIILDFDGVITNNVVHVNQQGHEMVSCSRADGLAFDLLRKLKKPVFILSSEKNEVVKMRAKKLKVPFIQGASNKLLSINKLAKKENFDLQKICYVGNDLNDYQVMKSCGFTACPSDSHKKIIKLASIRLDSRGGEGVVRELLESVFKLDLIKVLFSD